MAKGQRVRVISGEIEGSVIAVNGNRVRVAFPIGLAAWFQANELEEIEVRHEIAAD